MVEHLNLEETIQWIESSMTKLMISSSYIFNVVIWLWALNGNIALLFVDLRVIIIHEARPLSHGKIIRGKSQEMCNICHMVAKLNLLNGQAISLIQKIFDCSLGGPIFTFCL